MSPQSAPKWAAVKNGLRDFKMKRIFNKRGQSSLEVAITLIMVVILIGGIIKIWFWSNNQIVERQLRYNETRVAAGTASDTYELNWPVYRAPELEENEVLLDSR